MAIMVNRCLLEIPDTIVIPSQSRATIIADPRSGWTRTSVKMMKAYAPDTSIWRTLAISICRLEKYFARMMMSASLAKSDGWKENDPNENQLCAPCDTLPKRNSAPKKLTDVMNNATETHVERR